MTRFGFTINAGKSLAMSLLFAVTVVGCGGGGGGGGGSNANQAPVINGVAQDYARSGSVYSFKPSVVDPENDTLIFTIENKPTWLNLDPKSGELSGTPGDQDIKTNENITIAVSDGVNKVSLPPFSINVMYAEIGKQNIQLAPTAVENIDPLNPNKSTVVGDVTIKVGNQVTDLSGSNLQFEYDANGNLLNVAGDALLPKVIADNLALDSSVKTIVGMYTGKEINASLDIGPNSEPGIWLRDEFRYLVYFIDGSLGLTYTDKAGVAFPFTLGLAGFRTLIISDPTDPFFYFFGETPIGSIGYGNSFNANIPYKPLFASSGPVAFAPLQPFLGSELIKGIIPISVFKVFDVLELTGTAVCKPPQLLPCGTPNPQSIVASAVDVALNGLDPSQQLKLGINGSAAIKFQVLGLDLFDYHLLDTAAMLDIGTDREHLALQGVIDPAKSVSPAWLPIKPVPDPGVLMVANLSADADTHTGDANFGINLYGEFPSTFPKATISGAITINPQGLQMIGSVPDPTNPITLSATVDAQGLSAGIQYQYDFNKNIDVVVNDALDRSIARVNQAFTDLQTAIGNYDVALSLNGFRTQIPTIVDTTKSYLATIPGTVYTATYNGTLSGIKSSCVDLGILGKPCADSVLDEVAIATSTANSARTSAQKIVDARNAELDELKKQAQETQDGPAFRTALKNALNTVASHDTFTLSVTKSQTVDFGVTSKTFTFYSHTFNYTLIDTATKQQLQTAANNVDNIDPNYQVKFNTQQIYDALPKQEIIDQTRQGVKDGVITVPVFKGAGYTIGRNGGQSAYVLLGDSKVDITFNPLDPAEAIAGVGDAIAGLITP